MKGKTPVCYLGSCKLQETLILAATPAKSRLPLYPNVIHRPWEISKSYLGRREKSSNITDFDSHCGKPPKMDGEHNGKPYEQMDDLGGPPDEIRFSVVLTWLFCLCIDRDFWKASGQFTAKLIPSCWQLALGVEENVFFSFRCSPIHLF